MSVLVNSRAGRGRPYPAARAVGLGVGVFWLGLLLASEAPAVPALRFQSELRGDFALIGNTLGQECSDDDTGTVAVPAPLVGALDCSGASDIADSSPDVFWRADVPSAGQALADATLGPDQARSSARLVLPPEARPVYARLYWVGVLDDASGQSDASAVLESETERFEVVADGSAVAETGVGYWFQSTADVTAAVASQGPGVFRVGGVGSLDLPRLLAQNDEAMVAWWMLVIYARDTDPTRALAIFDGLDRVESGSTATALLTGIAVPDGGFDAKLGVVAFEGEAAFTGDALRVNGVALSDALNPADDFFNSTRSHLGQPVSNQGDLPRLTGGIRSMSGLDLDVVDVTARFAPGETSASISAESSRDAFLLGAFITSVSSLSPDFSASSKSVRDVDGGVVAAGDELEYTIEVENRGSDASTGTRLTDTLPAGVSYIPGSLLITRGSEVLLPSDEADDDVAELDAETRTLSVRLGAGADARAGGELEVGEAVRVQFRVRVEADAPRLIANQAFIIAAGRLGTRETVAATDGDLGAPGAQATESLVERCETDAECSPATPRCDLSAATRACVACLVDSDCLEPRTPACDLELRRCVCPETTLGCPPDRDGDGLHDLDEASIGTDPLDPDTDDDGLPDAAEREPAADFDGDGASNANDPDSDDDGLYDGTEAGYSCDGAGVQLARQSCVSDADGGATTTNPYNPDTDGGGASDGLEDSNRDGRQDVAEGDPNVSSDDRCYATPAECVSATAETILEGSGLGCRIDGWSRGARGGGAALAGGGLALMLALRQRRRRGCIP